jgi:hypothetical protein
MASRGTVRQFDPTVELVVGILTQGFEAIARFCGFAQTLRIGWVLLFRSVRLDSQIAKAPAIRELIFAAVFNEVVHLLTDSICIYKYCANKISPEADEWPTSAQL